MAKNIFIVMGVSGTGKTTIGKLLAEQLKLPFFDGDDFHPQENINKMSAGVPLDDKDRAGWLDKLNKLALEYKSNGAIIACSALKQIYRNQLSNGIEENTCFVFLDATFEQIMKRLEKRKDHFMPRALLQSQFDTLEPPEEAIRVDVSDRPEQIVSDILDQLNLT